jgi:hypothetical protein
VVISNSSGHKFLNDFDDFELIQGVVEELGRLLGVQLDVALVFEETRDDRADVLLQDLRETDCAVLVLVLVY